MKKLPTETNFRNAMEQDFAAGVVIPDVYCYAVFNEFLEPFVKDLHCMDVAVKLNEHAPTKFFHGKEGHENGFSVDVDLDPNAKMIISGKFCFVCYFLEVNGEIVGTLDCTRNLADFELPKSLTVGQLEEIERILTTALLSKEAAKAIYPNATEDELKEKGGGTYYTMNEVLEEPSEARVILASNGLLIPLWNIAESDRLHGKHWPYGRGVFISTTANLAAWINVLDHLRIVTCTPVQKPGYIGQPYMRMARLMQFLSEHIKFRWDKHFGYVTARPTCLGNTLQFNLSIKFPHLIKEPDNLRYLCTVRALTYHRSMQTTDIVRVGNQQCLGLTEVQLLEDFARAVSNIMQLEKDLALSNSMHIAALFVNIFRKKKALLES